MASGTIFYNGKTIGEVESYEIGRTIEPLNVRNEPALLWFKRGGDFAQPARGARVPVYIDERDGLAYPDPAEHRIEIGLLRRVEAERVLVRC